MTTGFNGLPLCPCRYTEGPCSQDELEEDIVPSYERNKCTNCLSAQKDNIWFQLGPPGFPGRCIIDELTFEQVWLVLLRNPHAKRDLLRITLNQDLISLANTTKLVVDQLDDDANAAKRINANTLPYYTLFKGKL